MSPVPEGIITSHVMSAGDKYNIFWKVSYFYSLEW